jgi:hypothetical protein
MRVLRDERGVVFDWLLKLVLFLAISGVVLYDAGSIVVNHFTLDAAANDTANAISLSIAQRARSPNQNELLLLARQLVASGETGAPMAEVVPEGTFIDTSRVIHIALRRRADTIIVEQIEVFRDWALATADGRAASN